MTTTKLVADGTRFGGRIGRHWHTGACTGVINTAGHMRGYVINTLRVTTDAEIAARGLTLCVWCERQYGAVTDRGPELYDQAADAPATTDCARHGQQRITGAYTSTGFTGGTIYFTDLACGCQLADDTDDTLENVR